jgi:hypothetical protein
LPGDVVGVGPVVGVVGWVGSVVSGLSVVGVLLEMVVLVVPEELDRRRRVVEVDDEPARASILLSRRR